MENLKTSQTSKDLERAKYVEKVTKLLALASSSNENEAQMAMLKAQKLMVQHSIDMAEVEDIKTVKKEVVEGTSGESVVSVWKTSLANIVANNFKCKLFLTKQYKKRGGIVTFLGLKEDVEICKAMYSFVLIVAAKGRDKAYNKISENTKYSAKGVMGDYIIGFINGLRDRFEEQKQKNNWGLMVLCDEEVTEQFENMKFKKSTPRAGITISNNSVAKGMGYADGKSCSMGTQIEN